jgi:hypothetical protein
VASVGLLLEAAAFDALLPEEEASDDVPEKGDAAEPELTEDSASVVVGVAGVAAVQDAAADVAVALRYGQYHAGVLDCARERGLESFLEIWPHDRRYLDSDYQRNSVAVLADFPLHLPYPHPSALPFPLESHCPISFLRVR